MKESVTYQAIVEEGRFEEVRRLILRMGVKRFGPASADIETILLAVDSLERLEALHDRVSEVETWSELLKDVGAISPDMS